MLIRHYNTNGDMAITVAPNGVNFSIEKVNDDGNGQNYQVRMAATYLSKPMLLAEAEKLITILWNALLDGKESCDLIDGL